MLTDTRSTFLESARAAVTVMESPVIATRWDGPSALAGYTIGGLTAHLGRAVTTPAGYLEEEPPSGPPSTRAAEYFLEALGDHDPIDSDLHQSVRQRSYDMAASGPLAVLDATRAAVQALTGRLEAESEERLVAVFARRVMLLDDYLETRIVELVVHTDDLAASFPDTPLDPMPDEAWAIARRVVAEVAAQRVGDRRFVLGLSRVERAEPPQAF